MIIETERLILRPWQEADAEALYKYASDIRVCRMALWPRHTSVEMSRQVISDLFIPNPNTFAIVLKETNEPIGCIGLVPTGDEHFTTLTNERETGYWIGFPYWNKGITTEALKALIDFCKSALSLDSLLITTDCNNIGSQRVAEKCGFEQIGLFDLDGKSNKAYRLKL